MTDKLSENSLTYRVKVWAPDFPWLNNLQALEAEVIHQKQLRIEDHCAMLKLTEERDRFKAKAESTEAEVATLKERVAHWERQHEVDRGFIQGQKERAESAEKKLESFTMRFGSYGTFTHDDILKEIEKQEAEVKNLNIENDRLRKENTEFRKQNYPYSWEKLELLEVYKEQQAERARIAEARLTKAESEVKRLTALNKSLRLIVK